MKYTCSKCLKLCDEGANGDNLLVERFVGIFKAKGCVPLEDIPRERICRGCSATVFVSALRERDDQN